MSHSDYHGDHYDHHSVSDHYHHTPCPDDLHSNFLGHLRRLEFGWEKDKILEIDTNAAYASLDGIQIPTYLDWRQLGAIGPIKDQEDCNACYAFAAIGTLEAHHKIKHSHPINLAEQEIVDCSKENNRCRGGLPHMAFEYIRKNNISFTKDYPYDQEREKECRKVYSNNTYNGHQLKGYINLKKGILSLIKALSNGPVATISYASRVFKGYKTGLYRGQGCKNKTKPNHSSVLIGYNLRGDKKYLIFKNGWGDKWGEDGIYKVQISNLSNRNLGHCMIAATVYNSQPLLR